MGIQKVRPIPKPCINCTEAECYNCDYALARWPVSREYELKLSRKLKLQAIARMQRQIAEIDRELEERKKKNQE